MTTISIGDFARATHLSVKALRYYHDAGLLAPAEIDPRSGYRRYELEQITTAHIIRRFRDLGMPVDDVRAVLSAPDLATRDALIGRHLRRLEQELSTTRSAVGALRELLDPPAPEVPIAHRHLPRTRVAAVSAEVASAEVGPWVQGALAELYAAVAAQGLGVTGAAGGTFGDGVFEDETGRATVFLPVAGALHPVGRVSDEELPAVDLAVVTHDGPEEGIDRAYGVLASYVARRALAVGGPIRELYPVNRQHTSRPEKWRTEIGWPIFPIGDGSDLARAAESRAGSDQRGTT